MAEIKDDGRIDEDKEITPVKMSTGQVSRSSLKVIAGQVVEECNRDLRWPKCMETFKLMEKDATIAPALALMEMNIAKVDWVVKVPEGYEEELKEKAEFLRQVQHDMDGSWYNFIRNTSTFNRFGFAPVEKVYRRRYRKNGSKYNDGKVGLRKLAMIDQDSVDEWLYDQSGRNLVGLTQWDMRPRSTNIAVQKHEPNPIKIPRHKFMLFRADPAKDNPEGTSPLKGVYVAWRFKTELEKFESTGVSQDIRGLKVFKIPARYMREDATEDEKLTYKVCQDTLTLLHKGEQSGVIIPSDVDFESNAALFDFKLESVMGQSTYDVNEIIGRYRKEIITGLLCQQLILGQDGSGSFALADSLQGATNTVIDARLREIRDQLNNDLIPQLFELNGWDTTVTPYFDFDDFKETSIEDFSKSLQRVASVGLLVANAATVNAAHKKLGLPIPFSKTDISMEEVREYTTTNTSRSGDGMQVGKSDGTGGVSSKDNSAANMEN